MRDKVSGGDAMERSRVSLTSRGEKRKRETEAPQDMKNCGNVCYVWGNKLSVMVDILVLGDSLKRHGNKAEIFF